MANVLAKNTQEQPKETHMANINHGLGSNYVEPPSWLKDFISHKTPNSNTLSNTNTAPSSSYTTNSRGSTTRPQGQLSAVQNVFTNYLGKTADKEATDYYNQEAQKYNWTDQQLQNQILKDAKNLTGLDYQKNPQKYNPVSPNPNYTSGVVTKDITYKLNQPSPTGSDSAYTTKDTTGAFDLVRHNQAMGTIPTPSYSPTNPPPDIGGYIESGVRADFGSGTGITNIGGTDYIYDKGTGEVLSTARDQLGNIQQNTGNSRYVNEATNQYYDTQANIWRNIPAPSAPSGGNAGGNAGGNTGGTAGGNTGGQAREPDPVRVDRPRASTAQWQTDIRYRYYRNLMNTNPRVFARALERLRFINPDLAEVLGTDYNNMITRRRLDSWREAVGLPSATRETRGVF